jgi:hypothetical protein
MATNEPNHGTIRRGGPCGCPRTRTNEPILSGSNHRQNEANPIWQNEPNRERAISTTTAMRRDDLMTAREPARTNPVRPATTTAERSQFPFSQNEPNRGVGPIGTRTNEPMSRTRWATTRVAPTIGTAALPSAAPLLPPD